MTDMPEKKLTLDEALALLDTHKAVPAPRIPPKPATDAEKAWIKKRQKVKDLLKEHAKAREEHAKAREERAKALPHGLNINTRRLIDQVDYSKD